MSKGKSGIEWTDYTWNPVTGCTKTGPGCLNCYAERMARRLAGRCGYPEYPNHFDVTLRPERLQEPMKIKKPSRIFVCSMSDLFHEDVPDEYIDRVFAVMAACPRHTFQLLTKRPERMTNYTVSRAGIVAIPNIWMGVTCENETLFSYRMARLFVPTPVKFVSFEPLLGPIDLGKHLLGIKWIIAGAETGPGARPAELDWFREIRDQCQDAGVPFFLKQVNKNKDRELDGKLHEQFPEVRA